MTSAGETVAIVHPLKAGGIDAARENLARWAHAVGVSTPHVVVTSVDSPGAEQARKAVATGADLVIAWGGDGTVTSVSEGLAGTGVPLGLIPAGTGNLLARNLGIPLTLRDAGAGAFSGIDRAIDIIDIGLGGRTMISTVMSGVGLDAILINASDDLKNVIGASAYVVNTVKAVQHKRMRVAVAMDGGAPRWFTARSVLIANVGGLIGGLDVVPEATPDDGLLHVIVLPLHRPIDWARTAARIVTRRGGHDTSRFHFEGRSAWVVTSESQPRQVDGEVVESGSRLQARVRPKALIVRVPGPRGNG